MRTLCLKLTPHPRNASQAEIFLPLTPFIVFRSDWIFLEIHSTSHLCGGEKELLKKALHQAEQAGLPLESWALAGHPYVAQALACHAPSQILSPLEEKAALSHLPLEALRMLEGLWAWESSRAVQDSIDFFYALGFHSLGQIFNVSAENFQWRWGQAGEKLWRRLHLKELQEFPFFSPQTPLKDYAHFDHSIESVPHALFEIQKVLQRLILRLEARGLLAWRWNFILHCEFSGTQHKFSLQPSSPHRHLKLALEMLERKLEALDLSNPLWEMEVELDTAPEKVQQLDFFQPRAPQQQDQLQAFLSLLKQEQIPVGFLQEQDNIWPEGSFCLSPQAPKALRLNSPWHFQEGALRYLPRHSQGLSLAPRPCYFLKTPRVLLSSEVKQLFFHSSLPLERIQSSWWESQAPGARDYFLASTSEGQKLWIYQDTQTHGYFLHGYFD